MPRVDIYDPSVVDNGNISSGTISAIANQGNLVEGISRGLEPVLSYVQKTNTQRAQTEALAKMSDFELKSQQRMQELRETDLGDQNIGEVYAKEMDQGLQELRNQINPFARDFFDEHVINLHSSITQQSIQAQASQNAARLKNSSETFTSNMQKLAQTDPDNAAKYALSTEAFAATLPASNEAKQAFKTAAIDSVWDAQASTLKNTQPEKFWQMFQEGYYNDKVTAATLNKFQAYRKDAEAVITSRIQVGASQAFMPEQLEPLIQDAKSNPVLAEDTRNTVLASLLTQQKSLSADAIAKLKSFNRGTALLNGGMPIDQNDKQQMDDINLVYTQQRNALTASMQLAPTATANDVQNNNEQIAQAQEQLTARFVQNYNILPPLAVAEISRKLGNYTNPALINEGMTQLQNLVKLNPVVKSKLPKEMQDDFDTFQMYADRFGNDSGQAAQTMIKLKQMTQPDQEAQKALVTQADTTAEEAWKNIANYNGDGNTDYNFLLARGNYTAFGDKSPDNPLREIADATWGRVVRGAVTLGRQWDNPALLRGNYAAFTDEKGSDLAWVKTRWQQAYRRGFMLSKGTDNTMASRAATDQIQKEFGTSALTMGRANLGNAELPTNTVMWMPPETVLKMKGLDSPSLFSRQGEDWDVIKKDVEDQLRFIERPYRTATGGVEMDAKGQPRMQLIDLYGANGIKANLDTQDFRLSATDVDKQTKTPEEFAANPVYKVEFKDANGLWQRYTDGAGSQVFIDLNQTANAIKRHRAEQAKKEAQR